MLEWKGQNAFPFSRGSSQPRSPALQPDSLPAEPQGKPKNTGVGSLSLLQLIFLNQESNLGLLHCRQILYQTELSGKPKATPRVLLYFCVLANNMWIIKWKAQHHLQSLQKMKYLGTHTKYIVQNFTKRLWKKPIDLNTKETDCVHVHWKTQLSKDVNPPQTNQ